MYGCACGHATDFPFGDSVQISAGLATKQNSVFELACKEMGALGEVRRNLLNGNAGYFVLEPRAHQFLWP